MSFVSDFSEVGADSSKIGAYFSWAGAFFPLSKFCAKCTSYVYLPIVFTKCTFVIMTEYWWCPKFGVLFIDHNFWWIDVWRNGCFLFNYASAGCWSFSFTRIYHQMEYCKWISALNKRSTIWITWRQFMRTDFRKSLNNFWSVLAEWLRSCVRYITAGIG